MCSKKKKTDKRKTDSTEDDDNKSSGHKALYALYASNGLRPGDWYVDYCASSHMTFRDDFMATKKESEAQVITADKGKLSARAVGDLCIRVGSGGKQLPVKDVLLVPGVTANLLSVSKMIKKGHLVFFDQEGCKIIDPCGEIVATAVYTE